MRYLVELYHPGPPPAAGLPAAVLDVVHSLYVPADETWFLFVEAKSEAAVRAGLMQAGLDADRISAATDVPSA